MKEKRLSFAEALEAARAGGIFTTHTPVPAGFDVFRRARRQVLWRLAPGVGVTRTQLLALGRADGADDSAG